MPKDTVLSALRVLVGKESEERSFDVLVSSLFLISHLVSSFCLGTDVRNHPILIHCKQGKVKPQTLFIRFHKLWVENRLRSNGVSVFCLAA